MAFMDWAVEVAAAHPELEGAFIDADGEWLDILLADGRAFRFRPEQLIDASKPEAVRRELLTRLISIGVSRAEAAPDTSGRAVSPSAVSEASGADGTTGGQSPDSTTFEPPAGEGTPYGEGGVDPLSEEDAEGRLMPIIRSADYFVRSHDHANDDSMVYVPMTPFIGTGIAVDGPQTIAPLFFSDLEDSGLPGDIVPLFQHALTRLRTFEMIDGQSKVQVFHREVAGAGIFEFTGPVNYQSSWFMDVEMSLTVSESLSKANGDSLPLFVPASRTSLFIVMADDPHLPDLFKRFAGKVTRPDAIYPLPHVVTQDGWSEWIPMSDHPAARVLSVIRTSSRARVYQAQAEAMSTWPGDFGKLVDFESFRTGPLTASCARWSSHDVYGSLPDTDFIAFLRLGSGQPWDEDRGEAVILRSQVARDIWHEGISPMTNVWPPRWSVRGFPDEAQLNALREASYREF